MLRFNLSTNKEINLNDIYLALLNYIYASQNNKEYILKIEDLNNQNFEEINKEILKKFAINFTDTYNQTQNIKIYNRFIDKLLEKRVAYKDKNIKNPIYINCNNLQYEIVDKDGNPILIFSNIIDDILLNIDTIIEFFDSKENSKIKEFIYKELEYKNKIDYFYINAIDKGNITIKELFEKGFIPDAIINYLLSINYDLKDKDIFYLPDALNFYNISQIKNNKATFDIQILKEFNKKHLEMMENKRLSTIVGFVDENIGELLKILLKNSYTINELVDKFKTIFRAKKCNEYKDNLELKELSHIILKAPMIESYEEFFEYLLKNSDFSKGKLDTLLKELLLSNIDIKLKDIYPYIKPYLLEVARCQ